MFDSDAKHSLDKTESNYCSYGSLPICKKGSPYLIYLKCYLKGLTMSGHNLDKLHWFVTPMDICANANKAT